MVLTVSRRVTEPSFFLIVPSRRHRFVRYQLVRCSALFEMAPRTKSVCCVLVGGFKFLAAPVLLVDLLNSRIKFSLVLVSLLDQFSAADCFNILSSAFCLGLTTVGGGSISKSAARVIHSF